MVASVRQTAVGRTKLAQAFAAARRFVRGFHLPGLDAGSLHTAGATHRIESPLDIRPANVLAALDHFATSVGVEPGEASRQFAAIPDAITHLMNNGRPGTIRVVVHLTDGWDTASPWSTFDPWEADRNDPVEPAVVGEYLRRGLARLAADAGIICLPLVLGVGRRGEVNVDGLKALGRAGQFPVFPMARVDDAVAAVRRRVTRAAVRLQLAAGGKSGRLVAHLARCAVDYVILIDRSRTMYLPADRGE